MDQNIRKPEFVLHAPVFTDLCNELRSLRLEVEEIKKKMNPKQELFDLKEACVLKGISYGSLSAQKYRHLQPNCGIPDIQSCGRSRWYWETIQQWLRQSDDDLVAINNNLVEVKNPKK